MISLWLCVDFCHNNDLFCFVLYRIHFKCFFSSLYQVEILGSKLPDNSGKENMGIRGKTGKRGENITKKVEERKRNGKNCGEGAKTKTVFKLVIIHLPLLKY